MAYTQSELARRFDRGETSGTASNVRIVDMDDMTALVGFDHAIYATRMKRSGHITVFGGWYFRGTREYAGSKSTKNQYEEMSLALYADTVVTPCTAQTDREEAYIARSDAHSSDVTFTAPKVSTAAKAAESAADFPL